MTVLKRVLVILLALCFCAAAVYAAERALRPTLADVFAGEAGQHGQGYGRNMQPELPEEHEEEQQQMRPGERGRGMRLRGSNGALQRPGALNEHFQPLVGLQGLASDVLLVAGIGGAVVGVDYALARATRTR